MEFDKDKLIALFGSIAFHLVIFLILFFTIIKAMGPLEEEEEIFIVGLGEGAGKGIPVNFGTVNLSAGLFEPRGSLTASGQDPVSVPEVPPARTTPTRTTQPAEELITQQTEESVAVANQRRADNERRQREEADRIERERQANEQRRAQEEQRQREQDIQNRVAGAFGIGNADTDSQGSGTVAAGNEGSPFGNSDRGPNTGVGGFGGTFNLSGRSIRGGGLPRPAYTIQEEGTIVVNITVDPKGDVIMAEIGRGTNIDNSSMRSSTLEAAKRAKFNNIAGTNNQSGTITYRFSLK
jgi:TonB family protein